MKRRSFVAVLALGLLWRGAPSAVHAQQPAATLETILAGLAKVEGLTIDFREEKRMSLVAVPLVSEGILYYQKAPRKLARHTLRPSKSSVLLSGNTVEFGDAKRSESMSLDAQPALRLLVDTFASVLAGDIAALRKVANVTHSTAAASSWRIQVVPKDPKLLRIVRAMAFEGRNADLTKMEMTDGHGDLTVTSFKNPRVGKLSPAQAKTAFRIGG